MNENILGIRSAFKNLRMLLIWCWCNLSNVTNANKIGVVNFENLKIYYAKNNIFTVQFQFFLFF